MSKPKAATAEEQSPQDEGVTSLEEFARRGAAAQSAVDALVPADFPVLPGATSIGLELPDGLTLEQWTRTGHALGRMGHAMNWWIGDYLRYGADHFGELMAQAASELGLAPDTLMTCQRVSGAFIDFNRRRAGLSFAHHHTVVALTQEDADRWLAIAENEKLSVSELRERIRSAKVGTRRAGGGAANAPVVVAVVTAIDALARARDAISLWGKMAKPDRTHVKRALKKAALFLGSLEDAIEGEVVVRAKAKKNKGGPARMTRPAPKPSQRPKKRGK